MRQTACRVLLTSGATLYVGLPREQVYATIADDAKDGWVRLEPVERTNYRVASVKVEHIEAVVDAS